MDDITKREPIKITAEDINPRYNWGRHLPVLGTMGVDFEERVDYRRLHRYRLGRTMRSVKLCGCGLQRSPEIALTASTSSEPWR